jgi:hypothetical protein
MLVKPPDNSRPKQFRIIPEPTRGDMMITYLQVVLIFSVVRLVMLVGGVALIKIPLLDPALYSLIKLMRVWFDG